MIARKTLGKFLSELASSSPSPGGGSASALVSCLGASLASMVCSLTMGREAYSGIADEMAEAHKKSETLRKRFLELAEEDALAFERVIRALGMPKETKEEEKARSEKIRQELTKACEPPFEVMKKSLEVLTLANKLAKEGYPLAASDAGVSAVLAYAGLRGASLNIRINMKGIRDETFKFDMMNEIQDMLHEGEVLMKSALTKTESRLSS